MYGPLRRRSHEGIGVHRTTKPILKRQSEHVRQLCPKLGSHEDGSNSSGEGWLTTAGSSPDLCPRSRSVENEASPRIPRKFSAPFMYHLHPSSMRITRRQESVTFEESIPVIMRRRGCTMTVRIVSVDDIEIDDEAADELHVPGLKPPRTPSYSQGSLPSSLSVSTRSATPSPRYHSSLSLPQVSSNQFHGKLLLNSRNI